MKLVRSILLISLVVAMSTPAAASGVPAPNRPVTMVATYFSNLAPRAGQHETVTAQLSIYQKSKPMRYLSGARLSVALKIGNKVLMTLKGTTTNKQGKAFAHFTVPKQAKGKLLWAYTSVSYKGKVYQGSNRVNVAKA